MDPLTVIGGALFGGKVIEKVLGPTADYIGQGVLSWTQGRVKNVRYIFGVSQRRLGDKIDTPGGVPPRVLAGIINEGSYCDNPLAVEYLGGVLASSRTEFPRDDRGASFLSLVTALSAYQLRTHYILYRILKDTYILDDLNVYDLETRQKLRTVIPFSVYFEAMDFASGESRDSLLMHSMFGMHRDGLIEAFESFPQPKFQGIPGGGIAFTPSVVGVELFLWGFGLGTSDVNKFFSSSTIIDSLPGIQISAGSVQAVPLPVPDPGKKSV
jgi:hypothetical protein